MSLKEWSDYFVAQAGASAALAGLLFVALSINIDRILKAPWLPARAGVTLLLLIGSVIEALLGLWQHESVRAIGAAELVVALIVWLFTLRLTNTALQVPAEFKSGTLLSVAIVQAAALPGVVGAVALVFGQPWSIYALGFSMLMAIVAGFLNSWVLLVEILR